MNQVKGRPLSKPLESFIGFLQQVSIIVHIYIHLNDNERFLYLMTVQCAQDMGHWFVTCGAQVIID